MMKRDTPTVRKAINAALKELSIGHLPFQIHTAANPNTINYLVVFTRSSFTADFLKTIAMTTSMNLNRGSIISPPKYYVKAGTKGHPSNAISIWQGWRPKGR